MAKENTVKKSKLQKLNEDALQEQPTTPVAQPVPATDEEVAQANSQLVSAEDLENPATAEAPVNTEEPALGASDPMFTPPAEGYVPAGWVKIEDLAAAVAQATGDVTPAETAPDVQASATEEDAIAANPAAVEDQPLVQPQQPIAEAMKNGDDEDSGLGLSMEDGINRVLGLSKKLSEKHLTESDDDYGDYDDEDDEFFYDYIPTAEEIKKIFAKRGGDPEFFDKAAAIALDAYHLEKREFGTTPFKDAADFAKKGYNDLCEIADAASSQEDVDTLYIALGICSKEDVYSLDEKKLSEKHLTESDDDSVDEEDVIEDDVEETAEDIPAEDDFAEDEIPEEESADALASVKSFLSNLETSAQSSKDEATQNLENIDSTIDDAADSLNQSSAFLKSLVSDDAQDAGVDVPSLNFKSEDEAPVEEEMVEEDEELDDIHQLEALAKKFPELREGLKRIKSRLNECEDCSDEECDEEDDEFEEALERIPVKLKSDRIVDAPVRKRPQLRARESYDGFLPAGSEHFANEENLVESYEKSAAARRRAIANFREAMRADKKAPAANATTSERFREALRSTSKLNEITPMNEKSWSANRFQERIEEKQQLNFKELLQKGYLG